MSNIKHIKQEYSSKDTSINSVSAVYNIMPSLVNEDILDYGGGKYDTNAEYMMQKGNNRVFVYDPYNRPPKHNYQVIQHFKAKPAKYAVCSNVLNVIKEDEIILNVLQTICNLMAVGGYLYIKVYERNKSGIGCLTSKGWQRNQRTKEYIPYIQRAFIGKCQIRTYKGVIEVQKI